MMVLATFETTEDYFPQTVFFKNGRDYIEAAIDPCVESVTNVLYFCVSGDTYDERKKNLEALAIEYSNSDLGDMSMSEMAAVEDFFRKHGKKYGLLRVFRENAIC